MAASRRISACTFKALHESAVATATARDFDDLVRVVSERACALLGADHCALEAWDERAGFVRQVSGGPIVGLLRSAIRQREGIAGQVAERRQTIAIEDYANWEHALPLAVERGIQSALAAPLMVGDRLVGVLAVYFKSVQHHLERRSEILSLLATQVAPVIDSAQLYAARDDLYERERLLREMSRSLTSDLDEAHALGLAVRQASELVDAPFTRIWLVQADGQLQCAAAEGFALEDVGTTLPLDTLSGELLAHDRPMHVADVSHYPGWRDPMFIERTGVHAYLALPIHRADAQLGVLVAMRPENAPFREDDKRLLAGLADAIAIAIVNARTLARLADSEQRLRGIYEAIACGVLVQDAHGVILHANSAAEEVFGYTLEQMRGRSSTQLWKVVGEDGLERPPTSRNVLIAAQTGVAVRDFTTCIVPPNGQRRWLQCNANPIRAVDGEVQVVSSFIDISARKHAEEAMAHQARHDALTGLPNRALFGERLGSAIAQSSRSAAPVGLLLMDLDHFKEVNDTLGHQAGDCLLEQVADRLLDVVRDTDTVARLGGDEFAIVLPNTLPGESLRVARKLLEALKAPLKLQGQAVAVSGSIGAAVYPTHGDDAATLLRCADVAMYVAKRTDAGVSLYSADDDYYAPDRLALLTQLREAIDRPAPDNRLVLHYQPKVDLSSGEVRGVEALVRWQHPQHGLLGPDRFVPLAEQTGMIRDLSLWVLETALCQAKLWAATGRSVAVAVNLSMRDLQDPELPDKVAELLARFEMPGTCLAVEMTESTLMADPDRAFVVLERLRVMGVRVAIDDFGTGYSSLAYLKRLPVDELKVDRSFIREVSTNTSDRAIVRSVIDLAHSLGLTVVAEGVEDPATARVLESLGCDIAQGFLLSRPLPADQLADWLADEERTAAA